MNPSKSHPAASTSAAQSRPTTASGDAVIYLRGRDSAAIERQRVDCQELAALRGLRVTATHTADDGCTGGPAFQATLADARGGRTVIAYNLDRLARTPQQTDELLAALAAGGGQIATVTEGVIDPFSGDGLMLRIITAVAQSEGETRRRRLTQGRARRAGKADQ